MPKGIKGFQKGHLQYSTKGCLKQGEHNSPSTEFKKGHKQHQNWYKVMVGRNSYKKGLSYETMFGEEKAKEKKEKMSKLSKGRKAWNKGMKGKYSLKHSGQFKKGNIPWNKGLVKEKDNRIINYAKKVSFSMKKKYKEGTMKWNIKKPTKPEKRFINICEKYNLPYKYVGNGKFWIENINPDFVEVNGKKICIEVFGHYWHSPLLNRKVDWEHTYVGRKAKLNEYGWKCIVFWDNEINEKTILERLGDKIGLG